MYHNSPFFMCKTIFIKIQQKETNFIRLAHTHTHPQMQLSMSYLVGTSANDSFTQSSNVDKVSVVKDEAVHTYMHWFMALSAIMVSSRFQASKIVHTMCTVCEPNELNFDQQRQNCIQI